MLSLLTANSLLHQSHLYQPLSCPHLHQRRTAIKDSWRKSSDKEILDPDSPEFRTRLEAQEKKQEEDAAKSLKTPRLAPGDIFDALPPREEPLYEEEGIIDEKEGEEDEGDEKSKKGKKDKKKSPHQTPAWHRKMVIREVRNGGRMTRAAMLAKTERSHLCKSDFWRTSIKKLFPLANQIVGKPLSEAMVQMRFSKKKAAQDVLKHLEFARDEAVVKKGMGLGQAEARAMARQAKRRELANRKKAEQMQKTTSDSQKVDEEGQATLPETRIAKKEPEPKQPEEKLMFEDKNGKKRVVTDPTNIYIDEAWVGRGANKIGGIDYKARGRWSYLRMPETSTFIPFPPPLSFSPIPQLPIESSKRIH